MDKVGFDKGKDMVLVVDSIVDRELVEDMGIDIGTGIDILGFDNNYFCQLRMVLSK